MSAQTDRARAMRKALSPPEARLWRVLKPFRAEGSQFRKQAPFRGYFLDFVCFSRRLVVEVDGVHHHHPDHVRRDAVRDLVLAREGFTTIRIPVLEVRDNLDTVVSCIRKALAEPCPTRPFGPPSP